MLTALYGIDHGRTLSIVQPSLLRESCLDKAAKLRQVGARVFDAPELAAEEVIERIVGMYRGLGMPVRLSEAGVSDAAAAESVLALMRRAGQLQLGERGILDEARIGRIVRAFCR
ncbi:iron-containing alcohol dehydrogenase [Chromobacterium sphagni]|uniref:iron-containing alcohol dehydrogenase n=1 Tax=Chromobacterium sphagni TaxID=1903179 RepID=UPI0023D806D1|nr:iron-containing alcohol dehydrogenase [Chromobacterium sphagni]